jgi:predicted deacylase
MAAPVGAATLYTGDRVDGARVIDRLDASDQPQGVTRLWFRVSDDNVGQGWYAPVIVIRGAKPGPRLLLTAGIHGDELNGIAVLQHLAATLDPAALSGTVVMVPGLNQPGLMHSTRGFTADEIGTNGDNLNRIIPNPAHPRDSETGGAADRYAARLWDRVLKDNADFAVDFHTQSRGGAYPGYVFAQTGAARQLADLLRPDIINMDPGIDGALENMLDAAGIPAVTYELGGAEAWDKPVIAHAETGVRNILIAKGMLSGAPDLSGPAPFLGNVVTDIVTPRGGWAKVAVTLNQDVKKGDVVATIADPFGQTIATLTAPSDGRVLSLATDPRSLPGRMIVRLIRWDASAPCQADGCPADTAMAKD